MAGRKPDDHDAKKERLRRSAALLMTDDRLGPATVLRICRNAGLHPQALHYYFENRAGLLWEVVAGHMERLLKHALEDAPEDMAPRDRLYAMARGYAAFVGKATPEHRAVMAYARVLPKARHGDTREMQRWMLHAFATALQGAAPGLGRERAVPLALSLLALLNAQAVWFKEGGPLGRLDYADMAVRMTLSEAAAR